MQEGRSAAQSMQRAANKIEERAKRMLLACVCSLWIGATLADRPVAVAVELLDGGLDLATIRAVGGMETALDRRDGAARTARFALDEVEARHTVAREGRLGIAAHVARDKFENVLLEQRFHLLRLVASLDHQTHVAVNRTFRAHFGKEERHGVLGLTVHATEQNNSTQQNTDRV